MDKITVIIPVHKYKKELLVNAINSVPKRKDINITIVAPGNIIEEIDKLNLDNINIIENKGNTDFCSQINLGVQKCKTKYFSILEYDDTYTDIWFNNVEKYIKHYPEISIFLPLSKLTKYDNENIVSLMNEIAWSSAFADENGFINTDCLNAYYDFLISGGIFNTKDFNELGGLKPSLLIASSYEMLLRYANNSKKILVIPKIGYTHTFGDPDSYSSEMTNKISQKHGEWLIELAQQEKYFKEDRGKIFEE
jgi:hypothetical protein